MNVLVTNDHICKLTDFGMSKLVTDDLQLHTVNVGTPLWMAPEVKAGGTYGFPSDIYSAGLVIFEIVENRLPGWDRENSRVVMPQVYRCYDFIRKLMALRPEDRITVDQALRDFEKKYVDKALEQIKVEYPQLPKGDLLETRKILKEKGLANRDFVIWQSPEKSNV